MFFSQEDYKKIQLWLQKNAIKDTEFNDGVLPLNGEETIALVQNKQNIKVFLKDFIAQLALLGSPDFINISDKFGENYISLSQAIKLIPYRSRKIGQVITFLDEFSEWRVYQFQGERVNQWNNTTLWIDLLQAISDSSNIVPDEEDITGVLQGGRNLLKFRDKNYNKDDYSGLGRVFLRKNLTTITNPSTGCEISTNLLTQEMISREYTIYIIQYNYTLNGNTVVIPKGSILDFQGGSIDSGTLSFKDNTKIRGYFLGDATIEGNPLYIDYAADEEDITSLGGVAKFKDKGYNTSEFSGLGRIFLRKNISNGKNIFTQDMINKSNTRYIIQYDYDLNNATITIPEGCVLDFQGGSFSNGTINFNNTIIIGIGGGIKCLFSGTIKNRINILLFGINKETNERLQELINIAESNLNTLYFPTGSYNINKKYTFSSYLSICGDGEDTVFDVNDNCGFYCKCEGLSTAVRFYFSNFKAVGNYADSNTTSKFLVLDCSDDDIKINTGNPLPWVNNSNINHCIFRSFYIAIDWKYGFYWSEINNNWFINNYISLYLGNANSVNITQNSFRDNHDTDIILMGSKRNMVNSGLTISGNDFSGADYAGINIVNGELQYGVIRDNYIETDINSHFIIVGGKYEENYNAITANGKVYKSALIWKSYIINPLLTYSYVDAVQRNIIYCDEGRIQNSVVTGNIIFNDSAENSSYYKGNSYNNILNDSFTVEANSNNYRRYYRENLSQFSIVNKINIITKPDTYIPVTPIYNGISVGEETCIREFSDWVSIPAMSSIKINELGTYTDTSFLTNRVYIEFFNSRNKNIKLLVYNETDSETIATFESSDFYYMKNMYSMLCRYDKTKLCYVDTDNTKNMSIRLYNDSSNSLASFVTIKIYNE